MKQNFLWKVMALLLLCFFSCNKEEGEGSGTTPEPVVDPKPAAEQDTVVQSRGQAPDVSKTNSFAFDFLHAVQTVEDRGKNLLLSPLSAAIPLGMLANGAQGETLDNILHVLRYEGVAPEDLNGQMQGLKELASTDEEVTVEQSAVVWADRPIEVLQPFADTMQTYYGAETKHSDFAAAATLGEINAWVAERTHDRIPKLLDRLTEQVYLIHTLYFKGAWAVPFDPEQTKEEAFTQADGRSSEVPVMSQAKTAFAYSGDTFDALELDYSGGAYSMVILLPKEGVALSEVESQFGYDSFRELLAGMYLCEVSVKLPKFKVEYEQTLNNVLVEMGGKPFLDSGDYSLLSASLSSASIKVVQKTFAEVNEAGTEAAAATYVGIFTSTGIVYPKMDFHVNRPFLFLIHEKKTGAILFAGRILNL
ncbi:MAG: serpin family protein [Tannerellaceae bacterium]|nr:serpin family protein [Tannerellaceae bacterium]